MFEFYRGKLVVVTGGTGLNGSYIAKALVDAGARVRAISHIRPPEGPNPVAEVPKSVVGRVPRI